MKRPWAFICAASTTKSETLRRYCRALYELGYVPVCPPLQDGQYLVLADPTERADYNEIVREKILYCLQREVPHGVAVEVTKFSQRDNDIIDLDVTIYCEKASHKGILIGKGGEMLKKISTMARTDIEKFMGAKVYLQTWVKVKENWRDNLNYIRSFGYNSEG